MLRIEGNLSPCTRLQYICYEVRLQLLKLKQSMCWLDVWLSEPAGLVSHVRNQVDEELIAGVPRFSTDQTNMSPIIFVNLSERHGTVDAILSNSDCDGT